MWTDILTAVALFFVLEGILPFLAPEQYRESIRAMINNSNRTLRFIGLSSMIVGVVLLTIVR